MATMTMVKSEICDSTQLVALYDSVGRSAVTRDVATLRRALAGSSPVVTARVDGVLLGLARVVSDGSTICYLRDALVRPTHPGRGALRAFVRFD